jgi:DNA-binding transcriptional regulator LsrR (DeoR family)
MNTYHMLNKNTETCRGWVFVGQLEDLRLLAKVAHLYYVQGLNQSRIARQLDLSQATVSRLLKRSLEEGIVRISVSMPPGVYAELEEKLRDTFNLKQAIVVDCTDHTEEAIQRVTGAAAAFYVENTLKKDDVVGLSSWSATLLAMVDAMHPLPRQMDTKVVQILGGVGNPDAEIHATRLIERFAKLTHSKATFLPAPGVVGSAASKRVLTDDSFVNEAMQLFEKVTVALVGIGSVEPSKLLTSSGNIFSSNELEGLRTGGAVGDVCLRFFDAAGAPVETPLNDRVIGMSLEQLKNVERTVGIAGGVRKYPAIRGALEGHLINVLITDRDTAQHLLDKHGV